MTLRALLNVAACATVFVLVAASSVQAQNPQPTQGAQPPREQSQSGAPAATNPAAGQAERQQATTEADRRFSFNAGAAGAAMQARLAPDAELAACLTIDNEGEVFAGQFAQQRAQNEDVKKFAAEMVQAHTGMVQKLQRFAGAASTTNQSTPTNVGVGASNNDRNATNTAAAPAASVGQAQANSQAAAAPGQPLDHLALKRELGEMCKQTFQREFSQKSGAEFDKCYMGQQVGAHLHAIDHMKVARNHASPELQQLLDEGIQTAETHLQHAKDLAKKLEGQQ